MERLKKQIEFLMEVDKMKMIFRRSYLVSTERRENDAEHSWHLAMFCVILAEYAENELDMAKVLKLVTVHDLVEIYAGDTYLHDAEANKGKREREEQAAETLFAMLESDQEKELRSLWEEFEAAETNEAIFANTMDRLQPVLLNFYSGEKSPWRTNQITKTQVMERSHILLEKNTKIAVFVHELLDEAVKKGLLRDE